MRMGFLKLTKGKVIVFVIILLLAFFSIAIQKKCIGECIPQPKYITIFPTILSPGITNLFGDNGFFINYKPSGNIGIISEGVFHFGLDIIYWYLLACLIILVIGKFKNKNVVE